VKFNGKTEVIDIRVGLKNISKIVNKHKRSIKNKKNKKIKPTILKKIMRSTKLMSLQFFAQRFNAHEAYLSYGIVERIARDNGEIDYVLAILVKGLPVYIDILEDKIICTVTASIYKFVLHEAECVFEEPWYIFRAKENELEVRVEGYCLKYLYSNKVFCAGTKLIIGAIPSDFE
jgi:hypothetical protein